MSLCPKRQRPSLEQYRCMYNFDGYFLLVYYDLLYAVGTIPTVLRYRRYQRRYVHFFPSKVPPQIVYKSVLATEGDAAVRHGCARRSRQRALHRDALHCASQQAEQLHHFKQRSPMSHRDTHGERRCRRGDARGVRSPPPRRQGGRGATDPNELDRLRAEVAVKERAVRDARSAEDVATQ